ncbi:TPA: hypothetical protein QHR63_005989 [Klebsiella michiganensis]|uniref:hypothetical protein n=1 Tax=Gammaproteobacteria TaxID=1236 RepID=UPI0006D3DC3E|nr:MULTISPECIES: hypothetical protein [Gammaproteobacteria]HDS8144283.1 hypothetical protein [Klebsiella michiganensis]HDT5889370.1 hypothetical protein [Aeromonas dhakensis]QIP22806.1 hypothetical protein HA514_24980 [Enterobacter kobei]HDS8144525.1 hypothetical protein [Klebsiella michiganensis]HDT1979881.1 hypothetical protein [Klebsiella michiganensis]
MSDPKNLETWLHEKAGPAHDALKADPARAVSAEHLTTAEAVAALLADAEATGDAAYIEHAHQVAARARTMHGLEW